LSFSSKALTYNVDYRSSDWERKFSREDNQVLRQIPFLLRVRLLKASMGLSIAMPGVPWAGLRAGNR